MRSTAPGRIQVLEKWVGVWKGVSEGFTQKPKLFGDFANTKCLYLWLVYVKKQMQADSKIITNAFKNRINISYFLHKLMCL